jgi:flavocytochrome c
VKTSLPSRRSVLRGLGTSVAVPALMPGRAARAAFLPQPKRTGHYDIVVVGTGLAGLAAALEAASRGAKVVVIEKMPEARSGGNTIIAGGSMILPSADTPDAKAKFVGDLVQKTLGRGNIELFRVLAEHIAEDIAWLKGYGAEFVGPNLLAPLHVDAVQIAPRQFVGMPKFIATLKEAVTRNGGSIVYSTKAKQLVLNAYGRVSGVRCLDRDGLIDFMAKAVVLATGGYAGNRELLEGFVDPNSDAMVVRGVKWATGDGLLMAQEIGAGASNMGGLTSLHIAAVSPKEPAFGIPDRGLPFCLAVNIEGKRFEDESIGYVANGKATLKQLRQTCALVFDEEIAKQARVKTSMETFRRVGLEILEAPTLTALAESMKMPVAQFEATVRDYNAAVENQRALSVTPPKAALAFKLEHPKYYAFFPLVPGITMTFGGLMINQEAQVVETDGQVIDGLLAAGEIAGALYYDDYIGGAMLSNCLVMGRQAGRTAMKGA